ncbi:hypothetical protein LTR91_012720 [Friedmanniomyces endolithicus]|uniref:SET domain-containing protein n=1 Tax=Friedmanniomyces endolithicus TaxID=329885 RepID=A0AAN6KET2_9PEZI|nr:hypothetical protein LTR59_010655 [Friedmanniomyces endolithicus]KAK0805512.1 hypothetical protein LTR38_005413 [Friedmanniomyces endolithicus]KAK0855601.1 hypothetical protein LTR03_001701 [Friedmanniomyces endolithicus]KAK0862832.1 hypothetical protein LTS02_006921 [Friedmanniomyces endolithicus]KAK0904384.1 hypothetical protein LTR57_018771 [Friedmanniomyces endolithicus]
MFGRAASQLHGIGLKAKQDISRGTLILSGQPPAPGSATAHSPRPTNFGALWQTCGDLGWINHSCTPNVEISETPDPKTFNVHAILNIAEGEELTIAYISPYQTWRERNEALRFACKCSACNIEPEKLHNSDLQRRLAGGYINTLRAFRARHFSHLAYHEVMGPTTGRARSLERDPELDDVQNAAERMLYDPRRFRVNTSIRSLAHDTLAVIHFARFRFRSCAVQGPPSMPAGENLAIAIYHRSAQCNLLEDCLGYSHPRCAKYRAYMRDPDCPDYQGVRFSLFCPDPAIDACNEYGAERLLRRHSNRPRSWPGCWLGGTGITGYWSEWNRR